MPKCLLIHKFLEAKISRILSVVISISSIYFFAHYGYYNYTHIPTEELETHLYRKVSTNLVSKPSKPNCEYDFTKNTNTLYGKTIPSNFDDFLPNGIVNGSYSPEHCNPAFSVAILVTYRNRQSQLNIFLPYMHNFLRKQNIHYKIFVIEQADDTPWNKGALYNIGAKYAMAEKFPCLILHDIDLLPLDESNLYVCLTEPRHMSASLDSMRYVLMYSNLVGGAMAIPSEQYTLVNGLSNKFLDWGGEDDDFSNRIRAHNLKILRFPRAMSRYTMLRHRKQLKNQSRFETMKAERSQREEGLSSVRYLAVQVKTYRLFTLLQVKSRRRRRAGVEQIRHGRDLNYIKEAKRRHNKSLHRLTLW